MTTDENERRLPFPSATIHLLISHDRNRRLLTERLSEGYEVVESDHERLASEQADLYIIDSRSFERHRDLLQSKKVDSSPVFLPYLLLTDRTQLTRLPDEVWETFDEVLSKPIDENELVHRIENLLERRRLSLQLKWRKERSEERFRTLFEAAPDPIVVTSPDGIISDVNEAFIRTFDLDREHTLGESITAFDVSPKETVDRVLLQVEETDHEEHDKPTDPIEWELDGGEQLITELNADVVMALGEASDRIGIFRDVTDREDREETLRDQNERLKEFASTIAHDLRNPLTIAQGHLELVRDQGDEHLETVSEAHDRMEQLIDELLTLAREGQVVLEPTSVSLSDVAQSAWRHTATEDATLTVDTDQTVMADEGRFRELFENLFRNSIEHGGKEVDVRVGWLETDTGFYLQDDGPGIPEPDRESVFEAGFTTTDTGTGFGLSIVRQIAEGHGWEVSVEESESGGVRFEFTAVELVDGSPPR